MSKYDPSERARATRESWSAPRLAILSRRVGPRLILTVDGEVDIGSGDRLTQALEAARDGGASEIWVDLTRTSFIDCCGIRALRDFRAGLQDSRRRLMLISPDGPVRRLLVLTGADREFEIHATAPRGGPGGWE